jgi:hypothetical protein
MSADGGGAYAVLASELLSGAKGQGVASVAGPLTKDANDDSSIFGRRLSVPRAGL